ncbi:threonine--tRNA ligase [Candidatus Methanoliparum sp. LAM-1]|uniref:threonine--tRNA ligase n=1 Tax=Candidatus Methanoliparum sp. LAM-1 TaxID=2874846 RepID=UPI001E319E48|nr:threonine--tRNA ligase [Candidatus Methanoliparum sp. LAM-1]BDC36103.1 threonine--tRNA ligase [Candidatus Methanoliparum sp. LAM-1]
MRLLLIHSDKIEYSLKDKTRYAEYLDNSSKSGSMGEALVVFVSIEKIDEKNPENVVKKAIKEIKDVCKEVGTVNVMLYPYAHLSDTLADPNFSIELLKRMETELNNLDGFNIKRAPFGWYKAFNLQCKGHPLSELSRTITPDKEEDESKEEVNSTFYILDTRGRLYDPDLFDFTNYENLKRFYIYESTGDRKTDNKTPNHILLMRREEIADYEPASDPGNMRYYPKGRLIKSLLEEYILKRALDSGAMEVETPVMYDTSHPALGEYLKRFPARRYEIDSEKKRLFLRFSACFGQFLIGKDMTISYRNLPLKMVEMTKYSFRREQRGELTGLRRLRTFTMPDMHTFCSDLDQAMEEFEKQYELSVDMLKDIGLSTKDYEVAIRFTRNFYEEDKEFIERLVSIIDKPVLVEIWDERFFYFVMKFEFNFIDKSGKATSLSTVQIDVENAERYGITYTDADGRDKSPIILHCSPSGAIERVMYSLIEKGSMMDIPILPTWLSPTQVRIIPIHKEENDFTEEVYFKLLNEGIRADIDDRDSTLSKKIREAEMEWIPYIVVIGEKERKGRMLSVNIRKDKSKEELSVEDLIRRVKEEVGSLPKKSLNLPYTLSKRAKFV